MVNELFLKSIHSLPGVAAGSETISTRTGRRFGTNNRCRDERMEFYFGHWLHKRILRVYWQRAREEFSNRGSSTRPNYLFIFSHSWCRLFIYLSPEHRHTHTHAHACRYRSTAAESFASGQGTKLFLRYTRTRCLCAWCNLDLGQVTFFTSLFIFRIFKFCCGFVWVRTKRMKSNVCSESLEVENTEKIKLYSCSAVRIHPHTHINAQTHRQSETEA